MGKKSTKKTEYLTPFGRFIITAGILLMIFVAGVLIWIG